MQDSRSRDDHGRARLLGVAAIGIAIALAAFQPVLQPAHAATSETRAAGVPASAGAAAPVEPDKAPDGVKDAMPDTNPAASVIVDDRGILIQKGDKRLRVDGFARDREFESFEQFVEDAPWLAGLVFLTVLLVFMVPLLIIVLLIWYKMRKNRLANETMLKLAERGVVAPSAAMDAVATGTAGAAVPAAVPAYEHARSQNRRAAWSDLRKGVILTGAGVGLTAYSILDDASPNGLGLVFLFVGLGYCLLWYFEDRTREPRDTGTPPTGSA